MIKPSLRVFCPSCLYIPFCITRWNCQISISTLQQLWRVLFFVFEVIFSNFWEILSNLIQNNFLWEKTCKLQANSLLVGTLILTKLIKLTKLVILTKLVTLTNSRVETWVGRNPQYPPLSRLWVTSDVIIHKPMHSYWISNTFRAYCRLKSCLSLEWCPRFCLGPPKLICMDVLNIYNACCVFGNPWLKPWALKTPWAFLYI